MTRNSKSLITHLSSSLHFPFVVILILVVFFFVMLSRGITLPFVGNNAWNFNTYSLIAHNFVQYGYIPTKLAPIVSVSEDIPLSPRYYFHHPQLLSVMQSFFFIVFGESFASARFPVILASIGSALLLYKIAEFLKGKEYGLFTLVISVLMPASVVFGRMIGQEPLVLFFVLLLLYNLLSYFKTHSRTQLFVAFLSVILGTLSDWPMVYFTLALFPFMYFKKELRLWFYLVTTGVVTALLFFTYSVIVSGGSTDLFQAFLTRGPGALLTMKNWYVFWPLTILLRLIIYYNPMFLLLSVYGLLTVFLKKEKYLFTIFLSLFIFGFFHIVLYPEGSFGHAYWIHYFLPFIALSASYGFIASFTRRAIRGLGIFLFAIVFFMLVEQWKSGETEGNLFRYRLASNVSRYLGVYEIVYVNETNAIDADMLEYQFSHPVRRLPRNPAFIDPIPVVYSCIVSCDRNDQIVNVLSKRFGSVVIRMPEAEALVFLPEHRGYYSGDIMEVVTLHSTSIDKKESYARKMYTKLKETLSFPQL